MINNGYSTDYVPDQYLHEGLKTYTVIMEQNPNCRENSGWEFYIVEAEDAEHAEEQAVNGNPEHTILWVNRGLNFSMENVYDVIIRATITKTIRVNAGNEDEAAQLAHDEFSVLRDDLDEDYDQETLEIEQVLFDE